MSVYAIQAIDGGPIKIGYSTNPEVRLAQLQGAHHSELVIVYSFDADQSRESWLHDRLAEFRVRGEWYRDDPEILFSMRVLEVGLRLERLVRGVTRDAMDQLGRAFSRDDVTDALAAFARDAADALADANAELLAFIETACNDPQSLRDLGERLVREDVLR